MTAPDTRLGPLAAGFVRAVFRSRKAQLEGETTDKRFKSYLRENDVMDETPPYVVCTAAMNPYPQKTLYEAEQWAKHLVRRGDGPVTIRDARTNNILHTLRRDDPEATPEPARVAAEPYPYDDMNHWFGLSYAAFLTIPRVVLESMPLEWQQQMARLLQEMDDTFDWRPQEGRYWVRLRDRSGRFAEAPLGEYRHRNVEHLRWPK